MLLWVRPLLLSLTLYSSHSLVIQDSRWEESGGHDAEAGHFTLRYRMYIERARITRTIAYPSTRRRRA